MIRWNIVIQILAAATVATVACSALAAADPAPAIAPDIRISPDDPASLQKGIEAAAKAGLAKVVIPPGTYRLPETAGYFYLSFRNLSNLEIDARGVTLLRTTPNKGGINFAKCRGVTLRGVTVLNETPPFTQGIIETISPDGSWYDVRIDKAYPTNLEDRSRFDARAFGDIFDPATRQWKPMAEDLFAKKVWRVSDNVFRFFWEGRHKSAAAGDLIAFRGKVAADMLLSDCEKMTVVDATFMHGSGFCVHETGGEGGNHYSYKVTYGPKPPGATAAPLMSANADAFHSNGVRKGPTLEKCLFEGMGDDGIPIHGHWSLVLKAEGNKLVVANNQFRAGDPLRLLNPTGGYVAEAAVKEVTPLKEFQTKRVSEHRLFEEVKKFQAIAELTLDKELKADFDWLAGNPAASGAGYVIRDNVIRNHRARGMLLKADNGLVENNTVEGSTIAGIVLCPELWWNECCYSRNVVIRNNTIGRCGYATGGVMHPQAGALSVCLEGKGGGLPGHRNIVIEGNTFRENDGINLLITTAQDVLVKNNQFVSPMRQACFLQRYNPHALVYVADCLDVRFEGNRISKPGEQMTKIVVTSGSGSKTIIGQKTGFTQE